MREHKEIGSKPVSYYYLRHKNLIIGTTMRAASSSMHKVLEKGSTISQERVLELRDKTEVIIWLRHPLERLGCAYHIFKKGRTVGQFIEHVVSTYNTHWIPQTQLHSYKDQFLPTKVILFESLDMTWKALLPEYPLEHLKKTKNRKNWLELYEYLSYTQIELIYTYYKNDLQLHRKMTCTL